MRYVMCINGGEQIVGTRNEIAAAVTAALLTNGHRSKEPTAQEKAALVMDWADRASDKGETQGLDLSREEFDHDQEAEVWRERGRDVPQRAFFVKVGDIGPSFRATSPGLLVAHLMGLLVADGVHLDRAGAMAEKVVHCFSEGGSYPNRILTELKDGRDVTAWWEDET